MLCVTYHPYQRPNWLNLPKVGDGILRVCKELCVRSHTEPRFIVSFEGLYGDCTVKRFVDMKVADQADACMERVVKVWTRNVGDILIAGVGFTCLRPISSANRRFQSSHPQMETNIWKLLKRLLPYYFPWADVKMNYR